MGLRIVIASDSRGYSPIKYNWVKILSRNLRKEGYTVNSNIGWNRSGKSKGTKIRIVTVYSILQQLQEDNQYYDMGIIQCGIHDRVLEWTTSVWKFILPPREFDKSKFVKMGNRSEFSGLYDDDDIIREYFQKIRKYVNYIIVIGMHSFKKHADKKRRMCHKNILKMNNLYSECSDYFVALPLNWHWIKKTRGYLEK